MIYFVIFAPAQIYWRNPGPNKREAAPGGEEKKKSPRGNSPKNQSLTGKKVEKKPRVGAAALINLIC